MIKYSIIFPYIDRLYQLEKTFDSLVSIYKRSDFEIVVVEDGKTQDSVELKNLIVRYRSWLGISHIRHAGGSSNPAPLYNMGVNVSFGKYIILSSPECYHKTDILKGLDNSFSIDPQSYVVCACLNMDANDNPISWYQHSVYRNALYHFCSAISYNGYWNLGGFDEQYSDGYCFDDDDFKASVLKSGVKIITRDDLIVCHQLHVKTYPTSRKKWLKNKKIYETKHGKYIEPSKPKKIRGETL